MSMMSTNNHNNILITIIIIILNVNQWNDNGKMLLLPYFSLTLLIHSLTQYGRSFKWVMS